MTDQFLEWWAGPVSCTRRSLSPIGWICWRAWVSTLVAGGGSRPSLPAPTRTWRSCGRPRAVPCGCCSCSTLGGRCPPAGRGQERGVELVGANWGIPRSRRPVRRRYLAERGNEGFIRWPNELSSELREAVEARPGARERLAAKRAETLEEIRLYELRHAEAVSQAELAGRLDVTQGAVPSSSTYDVRVSTRASTSTPWVRGWNSSPCSTRKDGGVPIRSRESR